MKWKILFMNTILNYNVIKYIYLISYIFEEGEYFFKSSAVDYNFSYTKIDRQIKNNNCPIQKETTQQKSCFTQPKSVWFVFVVWCPPLVVAYHHILPE